MNRLIFSLAVTFAFTPAFAEPVTPDRIKQLPATDQPAWEAYMQRSQAAAKADQAAIDAEIAANGLDKPLKAPSGGDFKLKLKPDDAWYAGAKT